MDLTQIQKCAFYNFQSLESINIPSTVREIGRHIFINCIELKNVDLSVGLEIIGTLSFLSKIPFESIEVPYSVKTICDGVFSIFLAIKES